MKREVDLQREIIDAWEEWRPGYSGFKLSNAYTSGIPDLMLCGGGTLIVEVKKCSRLPVRPDTKVAFDHPLTELQLRAIKRIRTGGASAAWWCIHRTYHEDGIFVGHTKEDIPTQLGFIRECEIRKRGEPWSVVFPNLVMKSRVLLSVTPTNP